MSVRKKKLLAGDWTWSPYPKSHFTHDEAKPPTVTLKGFRGPFQLLSHLLRLECPGCVCVAPPYMCIHTYEDCPESIQPCPMKSKDIYGRRHKIQEKLYKGQCHLSPLPSRHLGTSHSSPSCHQLPHHFFLKSLPIWR